MWRGFPKPRENNARGALQGRGRVALWLAVALDRASEGLGMVQTFQFCGSTLQQVDAKEYWSITHNNNNGPMGAVSGHSAGAEA